MAVCQVTKSVSASLRYIILLKEVSNKSSLNRYLINFITHLILHSPTNRFRFLSVDDPFYLPASLNIVNGEFFNGIAGS